MDLSNGIIEIEGERIYPGYTFEDFKKSRFYDDQDGVLVIRLDDIIWIGAHSYIVTLFFRNFKIYLVSLYCVDTDIPDDREDDRRILHERILAEYKLENTNVFQWGYIKSDYDRRNNLYSIDILYNP